MGPQPRGQGDFLAGEVDVRVVGHLGDHRRWRKQQAAGDVSRWRGQRRRLGLRGGHRGEGQQAPVVEFLGQDHDHIAWPQLVGRHIAGRVGAEHRLGRRAGGQHLQAQLIPARLKARVRVDLEKVLLAGPQALHLRARPAHAPALAGVHFQHTALLGSGHHLEAVGILILEELPAHADEHPFGVGGLVEQVLDGPLAFGVAIRSDADEDARLLGCLARLCRPLGPLCRRRLFRGRTWLSCSGGHHSAFGGRWVHGF